MEKVDFATFHSRLRITGRLQLDTPLHIGAGGAPDVTEVVQSVVKDWARRPYIPGSSFKGALRAHLEAILRALDYELACVSIAKPETPGAVKGCLTLGDVEALKKELRDQSPAALSAALISKSCQMCRVFGSPWLASKVLFKDMPVAAETWFDRYQERSGVGIDRDTETAGDKLLYETEAVPAGTEFDFEMVVDNADEIEQGLILLGIAEVERGQMALGGARSRGLGWVKLRVDWTNVAKTYRVERASLRSYLASGKGESLADLDRRKELVGKFLAHSGGNHA